MTDIKFLLESHGIDCSKESSSHIIIKCLNPAHSDNKPSMSIRKSDGVFQCWSCGYTGNYNKLHRLVTGESVKENEKESWSRSIHIKKKTSIIPSIKVIGNLYNPLENKQIREFLRNVGIYSDDFIKDYGITYSHYSEMIAEHLIGTNVEYTKMKNRICTPIYKDGKLINMEGRVYEPLEELPEGTPKILYVRGGSVDTLYNWENIDKSKPVVTTESVKNFWKIWNVYPNTVALFHAIPTKTQLEMLEEVDIIHFGDNDAGFLGEKASKGKPERKGTMQVLAEKRNKDFKICWDRRKHPNGKGYDANDCTLDEIKEHLNKAIDYSSYIHKPKYKVISNW